MSCFIQPGSFLCTLVVVRYTLYLYIYFLFSRKMAFSLLTDCQHISACLSERCLPVAGRFITVLIGIVSIPISMAYYFLSRFLRLTKFISCGALLVWDVTAGLALQSCNVIFR